MTTIQEHVSGLLTLRSDLQKQIEKIDRAIADLTGGETLPSIMKSHSQVEEPKRKVYPKYKLEKLIQEGYNHKWPNPEKIMWFLKTTGKRMYIRDMKQMTYDMMPELTAEQLDKIGLRLGYQAGQMAKKGIIEMTKEGVDGIYWLRDY